MGKPTRIERRRRSKKILFNFLILTILISFVVLFSLKSSFFNINQFNIKGNINLTREEVIKSSMISKGDNIFKIDKKSSIDNIKEIPYIKSISLNRKLPNKVEINIVERKIVFLIQKLSTFLAIDEEGFILEQKDENEELYPIFTGININNVDLGDNVFSRELSNGIMEFMQETLSLKLIETLDKVDLKTKDNIDIILKDGIYVVFGPLDNVKYKLRLLDEILGDAKKKDIKFTKIIMNKGENPILVTED